MNQQRKNHREYLIGLYQTRSIIALIAGVGVFCCTLLAVFWGIRVYAAEEGSLFQYFTVLSNLMAAVGAAFMIPYAAEGIREKRFLVPRWIVLFQFSGAVCVAITLLSTLLIIIPTQGLAEGLTGMNFWLHLVSPVMTVVLFQCVETGIAISKREMLVSLIPYWAYMILYFIMVYLVSPENGGWEDIYLTKEYLNPALIMGMMFLIGLFVALVLRLVQNRRAEGSWRRIARLWTADLDSVELKIEAFGLGRYMGGIQGREAVIPVDIFEMMCERYDVTLQELIQAYMKGFLDSLEERT